MKNEFCTKIEQPEKTYLISDTHFWHTNIIKYCSRPFASVEEMNTALIENWNNAVGPDDHIYSLGDFCFGNVEKWNSVLAPGVLNGHIHLVLGNHDPERLYRDGVMRERFDEICFQKYLLVDGWGIYLNHFPFLEFSNNFDHHVCQAYGHVHSGPNNVGTLTNERLKMVQWNQYDVGADNNNYGPISVLEFLNIIKERKEAYGK